MRRFSPIPLSRLLLIPLSAVLLGMSGVGERGDLAVVRSNENRDRAGRIRGNVLRVNLEVRMARWYPEAGSGASAEVAAFAEAGRQPSVPGPLIRVRTGTIIEASLKNSLTDSSITVVGFHERPAASVDSIRLAPGETRRVRFAAGSPGTYLYSAIVGNYRAQPPPPLATAREREQLAGAFIVDPLGAIPRDRVMVINIWTDPAGTARHQQALTINGKSWPFTERFSTTVGDTVRWRVINASARVHPMHLHGFYFDVNSRGTILRDSLYSAEQKRLAVTERLPAGATMAMSWTPDRPGNWLFHCHTGFHVTPEARFNSPPHRHSSNYAHNPDSHMAGLVVGITVKPGRKWRAPDVGPARAMRLLVQEGWRKGSSPSRSMSFVLQQGDNPPAPDSLLLPGSTLVLTRGEATDITVVNRLAEPTGVHWHGIELESYSDGVVGWSGMGNRIAPLIAPRDSFTARLLLPRAGTFIYHTHLNDLEQLTSGLYGAIVVLEPGQRFDTRTDHVFLAGWDGEGSPPPLVLNGDTIPKPMEIAPGVTNRFRLINIGVAANVRFSLLRDTTVMQWKPRAKDGADLPASQRLPRQATQLVAVGEAYDFEFEPPGPGSYTLLVETVIASGKGRKLRQRIEAR